MTDQELLEFAAKAAGLNVKAQSVNADDRWIGLIIGEKHTREKKFWSPLTDDGDALRLAVKLQLDVCPYVYFNERCQLPAVSKLRKTADGSWLEEKVSRFPEYSESFVEHDPYAATRRAIVRAAAEIGKTMGVTK
jgi:hypothetical protein